MIGDSNGDITSASTEVVSFQQSDGTHTATPSLTYKLDKAYNQRHIKCGFKNTASGNNHVQNRTTVYVHCKLSLYQSLVTMIDDILLFYLFIYFFFLFFFAYL